MCGVGLGGRMFIKGTSPNVVNYNLAPCVLRAILLLVCLDLQISTVRAGIVRSFNLDASNLDLGII